jgi:hypothetical protein
MDKKRAELAGVAGAGLSGCIPDALWSDENYRPAATTGVGTAGAGGPALQGKAGSIF